MQDSRSCGGAPLSGAAVAFVSAFVSAFAIAGSAYGSSTLEILGATSGAHPLTARVFGSGAVVTYFNPALLPDAGPRFELGIFGLATDGRVRLKERPPGADIPDGLYQTIEPTEPGTVPPPRPLPTSQLPSPRANTHANDFIVYAGLGIVRPIVGRRLVFGFHALFPVRAFLDQQGFFPDEREQYFSNRLHFELLGDRLNVSSINWGLGSQIARWLSLGLGLEVSMYTETRIAVYIPEGGDQSRGLLAPNVRTTNKMRPFFALTAKPTQRSSVVATVHTPFANEINGENRIRFWLYDYPEGQPYVAQHYTFTQGSQPLRIAVGGSYRGAVREDGRSRWEVGAQVIAERWSQYYDRQGAHPSDTWNDTLRYAAGFGFLWRERHVTVDVGYTPTPVPDQTGRTNYVDNARLTAAAAIEGPVPFLSQDVEVAVNVYGAYLLPRDVTKDPNAANPVRDEYPEDTKDISTGAPAAGTAGLQTNNPGYPGWKSSGYMVGLGATFRLLR